MKRLHVHVADDDLERSIGFYSTLFAARPSVRKADYAKWMLDDPRVNFAISAKGRPGGVDHLGVQVESDGELRELAGRLKAAGGATRDQEATTCCYAQSNKSWVDDPSGIRWETFFTFGEATSYGEDEGRIAAIRTRLAVRKSAAADERPRAARAPYNVLFLCTGNSARSILAEAILNRSATGKFVAIPRARSPKATCIPKRSALLQRLGLADGGCVPKVGRFALPGRAAVGFCLHGLRQCRERGLPGLARTADDGALGHSRSGGGRRADAESQPRSVMPSCCCSGASNVRDLPVRSLDRMSLQKPRCDRRGIDGEGQSVSGVARPYCHPHDCAPSRRRSVGHGVPADRYRGLRHHGRTAQRRERGLALLANTLATGCGPRRADLDLRADIRRTFQSRRLARLHDEARAGSHAGIAYVAVQTAAAIAGVYAAHLMFELPVFEIATKLRDGPGQAFAEFVATFGLIATILGAVRFPRARGSTRGPLHRSAYWFTASTSSPIRP